MEKNTSKKPFGFSKLIVYICLILLAITIIVPVAWVFLASVKQNKEFYGNPWTLPEKLYFQNFVDAWTKADMGSYILNSVIVTALAIAMLIAVALPAAYVLSRFKFRTCKFWNLLFMTFHQRKLHRSTDLPYVEQLGQVTQTDDRKRLLPK